MNNGREDAKTDADGGAAAETNSSPLGSAINCSNFKDPRKCRTGKSETHSEGRRGGMAELSISIGTFVAS